jgi:hypothetical protein
VASKDVGTDPQQISLKHVPDFSFGAVTLLIQQNAASFSVLKSTRINELNATFRFLDTSPSTVVIATRSAWRLQNAAAKKSGQLPILDFLTRILTRVEQHRSS